MSVDYRPIIDEVLQIEREEAERQGDEMHSEPRAAASDEAIAAAESARGRQFSDAYRRFLKTCDGWDDFAWGISLFGTEELAGEAYEDALETLSYTDDVPEELEAALIIGTNENDATLIMLLDGGEVVDHLYEETARYPDLASYLRDRKKTLLEMRHEARESIAATEREWDPAFRRADDEALAGALRDVLASASRDDGPVDPSRLIDQDAGPTPAPDELVVADDDGELLAGLELGLVLYLGAAPTRDETLETFRAFRRAFPFEGPMTWSLADYMAFGTNETDDPDSEPFADALRVDDHGFYGLRIQAGDDDANTGYILNVRGIPADDDGERRASFVEVLVPPTADPARMRALCHELADILPIRSGHGGWFARVRDSHHEPDPWDTVFSWCRRFFNVEPCYVDGWLGGALTRSRGAGWLTVLGRPFVDALGDFELSGAVTRRDGKHAAVLTAGDCSLGDVARGQFPAAVAEVARLLEPISMTSWAKSGQLSVGGLWFSTFSTQLPGGFNHHHATESFMRRFVDPAGFLGPSARERGLELIERLEASMDPETLEAWRGDEDDEEIVYFKDLLRALYSGAYYTSDDALGIEALEHAARFPGWAPAATYNNLLLSYLNAGRIDDGLALMPVALETARDEHNPSTYHNAACVLVKAGKLDEAIDCVRRAKDEGYEHMDKIREDEDLIPLRDRDDWNALFAWQQPSPGS